MLRYLNIIDPPWSQHDYIIVLRRQLMNTHAGEINQNETAELHW